MDAVSSWPIHGEDAVDPDMLKVPGWPVRTKTGLAEDLEAIVFEATMRSGRVQISQLAPKLTAYLADKSVEKRREALQQLGQWSPRLAYAVRRGQIPTGT